jgi:hypothetical protein
MLGAALAASAVRRPDAAWCGDHTLLHLRHAVLAALA